jgi:ribosomal-protein-alanine N-acetyltransferase
MTGWLEPQPAGGLVLLRPPAPGDEPALIEMALDAEVRRYVGGPVSADAALEKASRTVSSSTRASSWSSSVLWAMSSGAVISRRSEGRGRFPTNSGGRTGVEDLLVRRSH